VKSPVSRGRLRSYLTLIALLAGRMTHVSIFSGTALIVLGIVIHVWAKGSLRQDKIVAVGGPYRFVRHPFYVANAFVDFGIAVMSGWWVLVSILPIWWLAAYVPVIRREERNLMAKFPSTYGEYKKRVPALVPFRWPIPKSGAGFSWRNRNITEGKEIPRAFRILGYPFLFFVFGELWAYRSSFLQDNRNLAFWSLVTFLFVQILAWQIERHLKHRRRILPSILSRPELRLVLAILFLVVAVTVRYREVELDSAATGAGLALLLVSVLAYFVRNTGPFLAEGIALVGMSIFSELLWLAPCVILFYAGLLLDSRLPGQESMHSRSNIYRWGIASGVPLYPIIVTVGVIASAVKEMLD